MDGTPWRHLRKLLRGCASATGITLLMVVGMFYIATTNFIPSILSAAAANARTADPTPTTHIPAWDNNPQHFASAVRASVSEIWHIHSSYTRNRVSTTPFPIVLVVTEPTKTGCILLDARNTLFDPNQELVDACLNGQTVYYSAPIVRAYVDKLGPGAFTALLVKSLLSLKANNQPSGIDARVACLAGAWYGYATYWQLIHTSLADQILDYLAQDYPTSFETGRIARSLNPCVAG